MTDQGNQFDNPQANQPDLGKPDNGLPNGSDELRDLTSMVAGVIGSGGGEEYGLTINGQDPEEAIQNLHTQTGITVLTLGRRFDYGEEPRLYRDEQGFLSDWRDRFERDGHVFSDGERVSVPAFIELDENGQVVLVADDQDGRMADKFYPESLPDDVKDQLEQYRGMAVGCVVQIQGLIQRDFQLSDIHEYSVGLEPHIVIPPINPTPEQVAMLPRGARVIIEGTVVSADTREELGRLNLKHKSTYMNVNTDDGRQFEIPNWAEELKYDDGVLENMRDKPVLAGERVRLTSYVHRTDQGEKIIHSHYSRPYLVESGPARIEAYQHLRESVMQGINTLTALIDEGQFQEARALFSQLRTEELTKHESSQILMVRGFFPETEQPITDGYEKRRYWAESLDIAYDTLIESMTREEFIVFARDIATGRREQVGKHCDASYVYGIMRDNNIDEDTMYSVLSEAISERLKRLEMDKEDTVEDWHDDSYMVEQSMGYLSSVNRPEVVTTLLDVVRYAMNNKYYDKRIDRGDDWGCPHKFLHLLWSASDDLVRALREHPDNLSAIDNLDELLAWQDELSQLPYADTEVQHLQQVTDMFRIG